MKNVIATLVLVLGFSMAAQADVWKWVDADGNMHFVDTTTAIFTWVDENGDVHYSDKPDHEDAVAVELMWVSSGSLDELQANNDQPGTSDFLPGESPEEHAKRKKAEAYFCERATKIYESYMSAPRLYKTNESGERVYLNKEDSAKTIAETREQKDRFCG